MDEPAPESNVPDDNASGSDAAGSDASGNGGAGDGAAGNGGAGSDASVEAARLHTAMVDAIVATHAFANPLIERALRAVPRHHFLPNATLAEAYSDRAITTAWNEQSIPISSSTQPSLMAMMIDQLELRPGHRVLEIGAATGYNAAILRHIVGERGRIVTVDIDEEIVAAARGNLLAIGYDDVLAITADGSRGYPPEAPFDRILVTVGCPDIPPAWLEQLERDGVLVVPLALINDYQKSLALVWRGDHLESLSSLDCRFVALRGEHSNDEREPLELGPVPSIRMHPELDDPASIDAEALGAVLEGAFADVPTGVAVTARELALRLLPRIALRVPHTFWLSIADRALQESSVPGLFITQGGGRAAYGALAGDAIMLLAREPGTTVDEGTEREAFRLMVRIYGGDRRPVERLIAAIRDWDASGRTGDDDIDVAIWPAGVEPHAAPSDLVIRKPATTIVVSAG